MKGSEKMLIIKKILNNNTAVVTDERQNEKVVIGVGITYQKKVGEKINPALVKKTYSLASDTLNLKFQEILINLPLEQLNVVEKIIDEARLTLGRKISDSIYISLSDHIHFTLLNQSKGIMVSNGLLLDIQRFYPEEYKIGKKALGFIKEETGILLPDDEAGFIALHIVNAETENGTSTKKILKATKIIEEILEIIKAYFDIEISEDSLSYFRFINHLRYFSQRIVKSALFSESSSDKELLELLSMKYRESYQCCLNIRSFIKVKYETEIGSEELLYLTIHVQRAVFSE